MGLGLHGDLLGHLGLALLGWTRQHAGTPRVSLYLLITYSGFVEN